MKLNIYFGERECIDVSMSVDRRVYVMCNNFHICYFI